jgi:hypothetical protein
MLHPLSRVGFLLVCTALSSARLCGQALPDLRPVAVAAASAEKVSPDLPEAPAPLQIGVQAVSAGPALGESADAHEGAAFAGALPVKQDSPRELSEIERNTQCENHELHGKPCRVSWVRVIGSSMLFLSMQHSGNLAMDEDAQQHFLNTDFWYDYELTLHRYSYNRWNDGDPFGVDYVGHPIMGAITNSIYEQNDPKQRALVFENTHRYWMGRLRATAYSAIYSAQWKVGPVSESSMGNIGIKTYYSPKLGRNTNETGMVDFFVTPVGGLLWNVGEDYVDKIWFRRITHNVHNPLVLLVSSLMEPCRSGANILRFRAPWYRDRDATSLVPLR